MDAAKPETKPLYAYRVRRCPGMLGWEVVRLTVKGQSISKEEIVIGPDIRAIVEAKLPIELFGEF